MALLFSLSLLPVLSLPRERSTCSLRSPEQAARQDFFSHPDSLAPRTPQKPNPNAWQRLRLRKVRRDTLGRLMVPLHVPRDMPRSWNLHTTEWRSPDGQKIKELPERTSRSSESSTPPGSNGLRLRKLNGRVRAQQEVPRKPSGRPTQVGMNALRQSLLSFLLFYTMLHCTAL